MDKVFVPPIKIQGIKTKLVPAIKNNADISKSTTWVEPFMGSGVVGFNIAPESAIFSDINPYIIKFYQCIQSGEISSQMVRCFLEEEGKRLSKLDDEYYYQVRNRFNESHDPLDFLFLNRSCFNGMIRFNSSHQFNVPYGHKPQRFSKAYITKIVNQVQHIESIMRDKNWVFICQSFEKTIKDAPQNSFIYCDPPYIGRHVDYYDSWDESQERILHRLLMEHSGRFMLSTWDYNQYRRNPYLSSIWLDCHKTNVDHFYHLGAKEDNRKPMVEALLTNYVPTPQKKPSCHNQRNRSINPRYRKAVVPSTHTAENHDFISSDQGSKSSISKSLLCSARSGNLLSRWSR